MWDFLTTTMQNGPLTLAQDIIGAGAVRITGETMWRLREVEKAVSMKKARFAPTSKKSERNFLKFH